MLKEYTRNNVIGWLFYSPCADFEREQICLVLGEREEDRELRYLLGKRFTDAFSSLRVRSCRCISREATMAITTRVCMVSRDLLG